MPSDRSPSRATHRVSLWTVIGGGLFVLCGVGTLVGAWLHRVELQRQHAAALMHIKAQVTARYGRYEHSLDECSTFQSRNDELPPDRPQHPHFQYCTEYFPSDFYVCAERMVGNRCLARVIRIEIRDSEFSDADVHLLLAFSDLRELSVPYTSLTDAGVRQLTALRSLNVLNLSCVQASPETLRLLANCRQLKALDITGTGADDETVAWLRRALPQCDIWDDARDWQEYDAKQAQKPHP